MKTLHPCQTEIVNYWNELLLVLIINSVCIDVNFIVIFVWNNQKLQHFTEPPKLALNKSQLVTANHWLAY